MPVTMRYMYGLVIYALCFLIPITFGLLFLWNVYRVFRPPNRRKVKSDGKKKKFSPNQIKEPTLTRFAILLILPVLTLFTLPALVCVPIWIKDDLSYNGYITRMQTPVDAELVQNLCDWGWLDDGANGCPSPADLNYAQVTRIIRQNVEKSEPEEVKHLLDTYWMECRMLSDGVERCRGAIHEISYYVNIEPDGDVIFRELY